MNNNVEILIKLIVPAILLIFWALSNLFNRESNGAQARGTPALGPRPPGYPSAGRPNDRDRDRAVVTTTRPGSPSRDNDVLIIGAEANRPGNSGRPGAGQPPGSPAPQRRNGNNNNRGRNQQSAQPRRPEPERPRQVDLHDAKISTSVNQQISRPIQLRPLSESTPNPVNTGTSSNPSSAVDQAQSAILLDLRAGLASQSRIREAFVLNEILQPPVAIRNKRAGRGY